MLQLLVIYKNYINNKENEREHFAKNKCDVDKIVDIFSKAAVLEYIEKCYGIFHCEGDDVVLGEVAEYLEKKGVKVHV